MITVVGSSNTDFTVRVRKLPSVGETALGSDFFTSGGGKGANQAACIARLGGKVNLIANIGSDAFGDQRIRDLERFGVNTRHVKRDRQHRSGVAFILVDKKGKNLIAVSPGSNGFLKLKDIMKAAESIRKSDVVLIQLEIPTEAVRAVVYLAKRFNKTVILNPAPARPLNRDILSKVDMLVPNELEASALGGPKLLLNMGVGCVIMTRGKKGVLLINKNDSRSFKARQVKVVDTTCAGDAFCGALALGLDKGRPIEKAIEFANTTAALTCSKLGAQCSLPTLKEVNKFFTAG